MDTSRAEDRLGADDTLEAGEIGESLSLYVEDVADAEDMELWKDRRS